MPPRQSHHRETIASARGRWCHATAIRWDSGIPAAARRTRMPFRRQPGSGQHPRRAKGCQRVRRRPSCSFFVFCFRSQCITPYTPNSTSKITITTNVRLDPARAERSVSASPSRFVVCDRPLPGMPTVARVLWPGLMFLVAPLTPMLVDTPDLLRLNRTPGNNLMDLRKRMISSSRAPTASSKLN